MQTTVGEIIPLTVERFRICELYAELLHCSSLSLLNRPPGYGPVYDGEGRLTGGLAGLEELARVISGNGSEPQEPETPPAPSSRSFTQDAESPGASRGTLSSSLASDDTGFDVSSECASAGSNDDLGHLEEIDVHDESSIELRIPHSPQPSLEPLPPAPFAVPSPRSQSQQLPDVSEVADETSILSPLARDNLSSSPSSISTALPPTPSQPETADPTDVDPFADPHGSPTDTRPLDCDPPPLAASMVSTTNLDDSRLLQAALEESMDPSIPDAPHHDALAPPGELFKDQMLSLGILNTMLVRRLPL